MDNTFTCTQSGLQFGIAHDTPHVNFVTAIDLNKQELKIPYLGHDITIENLIVNYKEITSCRAMVQHQIGFYIANGPFNGDMALNHQKISGLQLRLNEVCFRVNDVDKMKINESMVSTKSRIKQMNPNQVIKIKINFMNKMYDFQVNLKNSVSVFKMKLISEIAALSKYEVANVRCQYEGFFWDDNSIIQNYNVANNSVITIFTKNNQGCFRKQSVVTMANSKTRQIDQINVGQQILSYNVNLGRFEADKVTFVHTSQVTESIIIKLQNGSSIQTTANHQFLCEDGKFKQIQYDTTLLDKTLKKGDVLRLENSQTSAIQQILSQTLCPPQIFYHLCIQNNHNYIVNQFIAHNMFVKIKLSNNVIQNHDIDPTQRTALIKEIYQQKSGISRYFMNLVFGGKKLNDWKTFSDYSIPKMGILNLNFRESSKVGFLNPNTKILTSNNEYIPASSIKEGDQIIGFGIDNKTKLDVASKVVQIQKDIVISSFRIYLNNMNQSIVVAGDSYVELTNGEAMHISELQSLPDNSKPKLFNANGNPYTVHKIVAETHKPGIEYFRFLLDGDGGFISQEGIVLHSLVLNFIIQINQSKKRLSIAVEPDKTIKQLKNKIQKLVNVPSQKQTLTAIINNNKIVLDDSSPIFKYQIKCNHVIFVNGQAQQVLNSMSSEDDVPVPIQNRQIYLQISPSQRINILYSQYANRTVQQIMKIHLPNDKSAYFFLFADVIIYSDQKLNKIQDSSDFVLSQNTIIVVKSQKWAFIQAMKIVPKEIRSYSHILFEHQLPVVDQNISENSLIQQIQDINLKNKFQKAGSRIKKSVGEVEFKKSKFFVPFLNYTSRFYKDQITDFIKNFSNHRQQIKDNSNIYTIIKNLYANMSLLPNYIGICYFGLRNFKFSKFFNQNQLFYWHNFTSARKIDVAISNELENQSGTLFIIKSISGKEIQKFSLDPIQKQVLFAPFSYFMVQKIQKNNYMDKVWLCEIPSPVTFQKNIILWVDDEPYNNVKQINYILQIKDLQILQVTSTIQAQKWVKQFGWLLNWKGIQFKLISDMTREQGSKPNYEAGIDLLQRLYNHYGFTAKTLIFCGNEQRANDNIKKRNISKDKCFIVTEDEQVLQKFCDINKQENSK